MSNYEQCDNVEFWAFGRPFNVTDSVAWITRISVKQDKVKVTNIQVFRHVTPSRLVNNVSKQLRNLSFRGRQSKVHSYWKSRWLSTCRHGQKPWIAHNTTVTAPNIVTAAAGKCDRLNGDVDYVSSAPCAELPVTSRAQFVLYAVLLSFDTFKFSPLCWRALIFIRPVYYNFFFFFFTLFSESS